MSYPIGMSEEKKILLKAGFVLLNTPRKITIDFSSANESNITKLFMLLEMAHDKDINMYWKALDDHIEKYKALDYDLGFIFLGLQMQYKALSNLKNEILLWKNYDDFAYKIPDAVGTLNEITTAVGKQLNRIDAFLNRPEI